MVSYNRYREAGQLPPSTRGGMRLAGWCVPFTYLMRGLCRLPVISLSNHTGTRCRQRKSHQTLNKGNTRRVTVNINSPAPRVTFGSCYSNLILK